MNDIGDPQLRQRARAAVRVVEAMQTLTKAGSNLVAEVLAGRDFIEFEHYPPDDVYDPKTHAQYYFHAHPPGRGQWDDYGHFHLFLRSTGIPKAIKPAARVTRTSGPVGDALCHLIAISMDRFGRPVRLFTTNRWVTDETWYQGRDVAAMLDRFVVRLAGPSRLLNRWLTAMVALYRPRVERLIVQRDEAIARWQAHHPKVDVFEDRDLEITSAIDIDVEAQLADLRDRLGLG